MLQLNLKVEGISVAVGKPVDWAKFREDVLIRQSLGEDFDDSEPVRVRKLQWWGKLFSGAQRGETVHKISNCDIELLDGFHFLPIGPDSPFGSSRVWTEVFSANGVVSKVNMYESGGKRTGRGLPSRSEVLLQAFNDSCTRAFGPPVVLSFEKTAEEDSDLFHIWQDDDSCVKSAIIKRAVVVMWETVPRA